MKENKEQHRTMSSFITILIIEDRENETFMNEPYIQKAVPKRSSLDKFSLIELTEKYLQKNKNSTIF